MDKKEKVSFSDFFSFNSIDFIFTISHFYLFKKELTFNLNQNIILKKV